jgi:hypothetical protein
MIWDTLWIIMDDSVIIDDYYGIYPSQWDYQKPHLWLIHGIGMVKKLALPHQL